MKFISFSTLTGLNEGAAWFDFQGDPEKQTNKLNSEQLGRNMAHNPNYVSFKKN